MNLKRVLIIGWMWLLLKPGLPLSHPVAAQEQKPLEHQVAVTVKLVQVYVVDKDGKPVQDLTKDDFIVTDNARPVVITEFEKHFLEAPRPPTEKIIPTAAPSPSPSVMSRKFFLFFDFAFNNQRGINKSKEAALHFIDAELKPDDEVALMSYSMLNGLAVHEYLTTDHQKVREAVQALSTKRISGRAGDIEEQYWRQATEGLSPESVFTPEQRPIDIQPTKTPPLYNWRRQESKNISENFILKLTAIAKALRYIPGQKQLIMFSTGLSNSLIYGNQAGNPQDSGILTGEGGTVLPTTNPAYGRSKFDAGDHILRTLNEGMLKEITSANCTVFAFDTREAALVPSLFTYDEQTFEENRRDIFYDRGIHQTATNPMKDDKITGQYSLRRLSATSGGKYFSNIEKYKDNLNEVQTLTGSYYVLGYYIGEQWDGQFHSIKVDVKRKGCDVHAQMGYYNPKPFAEYSDVEKQLQLFDLALSDRPLFQTPLTFSIGGISYAAGEETRLLMLSKIPARVMAKFGGRRAEFVTLIFDAKENLIGLQRREADLTKYKNMDALFTSGAALASGNYKCRLVIRDLDTGTSAVASTRINVPRKTFVGLSLHTPLLLLPESSANYLEAATLRAHAPAEWKDIYVFDRAQYTPTVGEITKGTSALFALVPCTSAGLVQPEVTLAAYLINAASGEQIPLACSILSKAQKNDTEVQFVRIPLDNIPPGKYLLYFHAEEAAGKYISYAQTPILVR